jgi:SulP family sulfate permease
MAVVPGIVAALAGSSWHAVSGPTNANSLALFAMLAPLAVAGSPQYIELALAVTVLVGVLQAATGLLRLGAIAHFISPTALLGFTSGAAVLIAAHALKELLGLTPEMTGSMPVMLGHLLRLDFSVSPGALLIGLVTLAMSVSLRRWRPRWPGMLIALALGSVLAWLLEDSAWRVRELGPLPSPCWPSMSRRCRCRRCPTCWASPRHSPSSHWPIRTIAIAKAIAARSRQRIDANREFPGQGLSNVVGGFFSCDASCGSLNRSLPHPWRRAPARPWPGVSGAAPPLPPLGTTAPSLAHIPFAAISGLLGAGRHAAAPPAPLRGGRPARAGPSSSSA